ncbi:hypothetical protein D3Z58_12275 [Clostridiaceae bacterium]|nr:hypothetical protein [Clostridiaceae bacterium]
MILKTDTCESCGGQLERKNSNLYQCASCGQKYYISADKLHKVSVQLSAGKIILICAAIVMAISAVAVVGYQFYTGKLVVSASRFSVVFRDFLMEAYQKPAAEISSEDLAKIKYLKIEQDKGYRFTYSFEDYYDYKDRSQYEKTLSTITIKAAQSDFSPSNIEYFTGLTRLELYTEAWENYVLPEENVLRCIYCMDGLSRYGTPRFFDRINPDTLEEVAIFNADGLNDFSFLDNLKGIKRFTLENATIHDKNLLNKLSSLEQLSLCYVRLEEDQASEILGEFLTLPSLKHFYIEGTAAWYISEDQWSLWELNYQGQIVLERK